MKQPVVSRPSSDMAAFRKEIKNAQTILILSGAGVSAESGIPTFRGEGGLWRRWRAQDLASPEAFKDNPSLVWEFYHHRREVVFSKNPNRAHESIASFQHRMKNEGKSVTVVTQNIDELHTRAGAQNVVELHGSLFKTRCLKCGEVKENRDSPICEALKGKGEPDPSNPDAHIPVGQLPTCTKSDCGGLLRPHVVWFGEGLEQNVLNSAEQAVDECDLCMVVGTSSVVYPAAMFAPSVASRGVTVAEFNLEDTPATMQFKYHFCGPAGTFVPQALDP